jgi:hypothetical protein
VIKELATGRFLADRYRGDRQSGCNPHTHDSLRHDDPALDGDSQDC